MNKDRLEEIVEKIAEQLYDRIVVPKTKVTMEYQDIKYLFNTIEEQAERVQELEENLEHGAKVAVKTAEKLHYEQQQNKRYRDLLTSRIVKQLIRLEDKGCFLPDEDREDFLNLKYTVEALEGEE